MEVVNTLAYYSSYYCRKRFCSTGPRYSWFHLNFGCRVTIDTFGSLILNIYKMNLTIFIKLFSSRGQESNQGLLALELMIIPGDVIKLNSFVNDDKAK